MPNGVDVVNGKLTLPGYRNVVTIGTGAIDWNLATKYGPVWAKNFMSLYWLQTVYLKDRYALPRVEQIAADFAAHIPIGGGPAPTATWSAMYAGQRAVMYGCLVSIDPTFAAGFRELRAMGPWLANPAHDPGNWNQGVDFRLGGLSAGCATGNATWAALARDKLGALASTAIDAQGAPLEQSTGYGSRLVNVFNLATTQLNRCYSSAPSVIGTRVRLLQRFLAWAKQPDGLLSVLGDSSYGSANLGCPMSAEGPQPTGMSGTSKIFSAGYAFGRTSWSTTTATGLLADTGFARAGYYSLRFGPGRVMHGHNDHQSVTWNARSDSILVDAGYRSGRTIFNVYARTPEAHNVLTEPGVPFSSSAKTTLSRPRVATGWQSYELTDTAYGGRARTRDILIDLTAGIMFVEDRASRATSGTFTQLWHLPPDDSVSVNRNGYASAGRCPDTALRIVPLPLRGETIPLHSTDVVKGSKSPYQGWVDSQATNDVQAAPVIVLRRTGTSTRMVTVLTVGGRTASPRITRTWSATGGYLYTIRNGSAVRRVHMDNAGLLTEV
ncbi:MAG: heparinase II/III family protein [Frankiaceae bacterium]|nr:heparinase II/III family protein [Frankiaceae bacterium]